MSRRNSVLMCILVLLAVLSLGFFTPTADASPFSWEFSGGGFATLNPDTNPVVLEDIGFKISLFGDTVNVIDDGLGPLITAGLTGTLKLVGGNLLSPLFGSFVDPLYLYVNPVLGSESVGFGTGSGSDPNVDQEQLIFYAEGLGAYDLKTPFGPISATNFYYANFASLINFGGIFGPDLVTFDSIDNGSFQAPVPEPATMLLLGSGLLGLAGFRRKFRR